MHQGVVNLFTLISTLPMFIPAFMLFCFGRKKECNVTEKGRKGSGEENSVPNANPAAQESK